MLQVVEGHPEQGCVSYLSHCYGPKCNKKQCKGEWICFVSQFECTQIHDGREGKAADCSMVATVCS